MEKTDFTEDSLFRMLFAKYVEMKQKEMKLKDEGESLEAELESSNISLHILHERKKKQEEYISSLIHKSLLHSNFVRHTMNVILSALNISQIIN